MVQAKIFIIGDGVIGLTIAWRLAGAGYQVVCAGDGAQRSSEAAAGMLAPSFERDHPRAARSLGKLLEEGLADWDDFAVDLIAETGADFGYQRNGIIGVGFANPPGRNAIPCDPPDGFTSGRAFRIEGEGQADPRLLRQVLAAAFKAHGGIMLNGHVEAVEFSSAAVMVRIDGESHQADRVVFAGGRGASELFGGNWREEGVRGRSFLHHAPGLKLPSVVRSPTVYFCPKGDDLLYVGATEEVPEGEPAMLDGLWWEALALCPGLGETERVATFDGIRPALASGLPEIGEWAEDQRLLLAFGHDRNGVLLAPLTARRIFSLISDTL